ncbi:hypothetical protein N7471_002228 [Penicillium samsonianum]|uniref:uncharacterized protein n=1 Tax=Penicillium samsonianum TaxID=1882272 RepID=UPI00254760AA|nr:uncharacterized protein N7471_002228 [Penicillium samsonianum]KAJ6142775.1 hypothetical protein N7471_002228 [Penicillium samsonianum]
MGYIYVSDIRPNDGTKLTILSVSATIVARIPYLHNYKSPEFLYKLLFFKRLRHFEFNLTAGSFLDATINISILSNIKAGLSISTRSLNTFRVIIYGESRSPNNALGGIIHYSFNGTLSHPVRSIEFGHYGNITIASLDLTRRDNS